MVNSVHAKLSVVRQCILLKVARSSLYYEKTGESGINLTLMQEVDRAFTEWPFLGVRQMCRYLVSLGYGVGRKRGPPPDAVDGVHDDIPETENQRAEPGA